MSIGRVRSQPALANARFKGTQQASQQKSTSRKPSPFASGQHCNAMYPDSWKSHTNKEALSKQPYTRPQKTDDPKNPEPNKPEDNKPQPNNPENSDKLKDIPKKILDKLGETARKDLPEMLDKGLAKLENGALVFGGAALLGKKVLDKTLQYWQRFSNCGLEAGCNLKKVFLMSEQYAKAEKEKPGSGLEAVEKFAKENLSKDKWASWGMKNLKHNSGGMTYDSQQAWNMKNKLKIRDSKGFIKADKQKLIDMFAQGHLLQRNGHGHSWSYSGMKIGEDGKVALLRTDSSYRDRRSQWEPINKVFFGGSSLYGLFTKQLDTVV